MALKPTAMGSPEGLAIYLSNPTPPHSQSIGVADVQVGAELWEYSIDGNLLVKILEYRDYITSERAECVHHQWQDVPEQSEDRFQYVWCVDVEPGLRIYG